MYWIRQVASLAQLPIELIGFALRLLQLLLRQQFGGFFLVCVDSRFTHGFLTHRSVRNTYVLVHVVQREPSMSYLMLYNSNNELYHCTNILPYYSGLFWIGRGNLQKSWLSNPHIVMISLECTMYIVHIWKMYDYTNPVTQNSRTWKNVLKVLPRYIFLSPIESISFPALIVF